MRYSNFLPICGALSVLVFLCGCSYLIPDNPSAPRYNTVAGERHRPQLNGNGGQPASESAPAPAPRPQSMMAPAAPVTPVASAPWPAPAPASEPQTLAYNSPQFPPVDPRTQARADQIMRQVPAENLAANSVFSTVPPRPEMNGNASDAQRMENARRQLEQDRTNANTARDQLSRDAASEPSMLRPPPEGTVPPPAPVSVNPLAPPANGLPPTSALWSAQTASTMQPGYIAVPQNSSFAPPMPTGNIPQPMPAPAGGSWMANNGGLEPIVLRPPASMSAPLPVSGPTRLQSRNPQTMPPVASGGFNPMASGVPANNGSSYASAGYLPDSRYTR